jgi:hypothetical protein
MLNTDSRISDPKFDNINLVLRASQIKRELNCSFAMAFAQAEAEQRQQPSAQRHSSGGVALSHGQRQKIESINLIGNVRLT